MGELEDQLTNPLPPTTHTPLTDQEVTDVREVDTLTKGRNTLIFLGIIRVLPSIWEQPFLLRFLPVAVMESVT